MKMVWLSGQRDTAQLEKWLKTSEAGDTLIYHQGLLMADRLDDVALDEYAQRLLWESEWSERVALVQKRKSEGVCEYRAIKR